MNRAFDDALGQRVTLRIARFGPPGAFLVRPDDPPDAPTLLLPGAEIPEGSEVDQALDVFVYKDSEDRPVATLLSPKLHLGEVGFLRVTAVEAYGAFVDWGLPKELLVPRVEQIVDARVGERYAVGLYVDDTGRLAGTMQVAELLGVGGGFTVGEWVDGEAWRKDPDTGVFVILERQFVGLIPASEPTTLTRGEAVRVRVARVLLDGKVVLSLRGSAYEEQASDAARVLAVLNGPNAPKVGDRSDPEDIRRLFGMSKKAWKRAAGYLLKSGQATFDGQGFLQVGRPIRGKPPTGR